MSEDLSITLVSTASGQSETLPLPSIMTVREVADLVKALFGMNSVHLFKDGRGLNPAQSLQAAGVKTGDLLAAQEAQQQQQQSRPPPPAAAAAAPAGFGGLDFSSLLGSAAPAAPGAAAASSSSPSSTASAARAPVYFPGMSVEECMSYNPHPHNFITLLQTHEHLFKELRYHQPQLAQKLYNQPRDKAVQIWREEMVKGGIASAVKQTEKFHKEQEMKRRLQQDPNDDEAKAYFAETDRKVKVHEQFLQMMESYPESMGRVLMLYVEAKINGHPIQAFCDSGAQMTIMSRKVAAQCGLEDLIDTNFAGMAAGVGTGKILGRIHIVQLQIGKAHYPCSVSVMDDPAPGATEMPFLLGLDMMKRHLCQIDLQKSVLRFNSGGSQEEIPFLHEKDLDQSQGGTRGFDADKANEELRKRQEEHKKDGDGDAEMKDS